MSSLRAISTSIILATAVLALSVGQNALAETHEAKGDAHEAEVSADAHHGAHTALKPATHYDGRTPIDRSHGTLGDNGTVGAANPEYEAKAKADLTAPGMFAAPYAYSQKAEFLAALQNRLHFFDEAMINLKTRTEITKPETAKFADDTMAKLQDLIKQARDAEKAAKSAGEKEWTSAEANAHTSFANLKKTYETIMHPVH